MVRFGALGLAVVFGLLALSVLASSPASAWHIGEVIQVSQGAASQENNPSVAFGADGQLYVAYSRNSGGALDIVVRADQDGWASDSRPVFTSFRVVNDAAGMAGWGFFDTVPMVVDHQGSIYVAWADRRDAGTTGWDIRVARSDNDGSSFGASTRISDFTGLNGEGYPRLAVGPSGTVYAVFIDDRDGGDDVFFSRSTDRGASWSPNAKLNEVTGNADYPRIAADSMDRVFVTWTDFTGPNLEVMFDMSSDGGLTWGTDKPIGDSSASSWIADIAVGRNDIVHIAWQDDRTGDSGIYYTRSLDHGQSFLPDGRANWIGAGGDPLPRIATMPNGLVLIVWGEGGPPANLYYTLYAEDGAVFAGLGYVVSNAQRYGIGIDPSGNVFPVWSQDDGGPALEVYTQFADAPPGQVMGVTVVPGFSPGTATVTWTASPEPDVVGYQVWRTTPDGDTTMVAFVTTTTYADAGLADGRWWYSIVAVDRNGHNGDADSDFIDIGLTTDDRLDALEARLNNLENQVTTLQGDVTDLQTQNGNLQSDLDDANTSLGNLGQQLASSQQLNMILLILVLVLVVVSMVLGMRRKRTDTVVYQPPMQSPPPPQ